MNIYNSLNHINFNKKKTTPVVEIPNYLLTSNINCCWASRLLISSYTGPIFYIRRSDNTFANIYTDSTQSWVTLGPNNTLQSYSSWITGYIGYINIWYDQSGKANHLKNITNNTTQPTLVAVNGKYVVNWINTNSTVLTMTTALTVNTIFTHFYNTNSAYGSIISSGIDVDKEQRFGGGGALFINGDNNTSDWFNSSTGTKISYANGISTLTLSGLNTWQLLSLSVQTPPFFLSIVGRDGYSNTRSINGYMSEMILHNKQMNSTDMLSYYNNRIF